MEEKLNKLITDVEVIKIKLESFTSIHVEKIEDHEQRLRSLETFKMKALGAIILASVVFNAFSAFIISIISK